jgi:hypothetical protein
MVTNAREKGRKMNYPEPPDITREPERANIERILEYLGQLEAVPGDALDAVEGLLIRAEVAEQQAAGRTQGHAETATTVTVQLPASQRKAFRRQVVLAELAITCRRCGRTVIVKHYPGTFPPRECSPACQEIMRRQDNAARQHRFRARRGLAKAGVAN